MSEKTALVTGANGFVGSHLVDRLLAEGYRVKCIVRKTSNLQWLKGKPVELINAGLGNKEELKKAIEGCSLVFHIAGTVKSKKPQGYFDSNVGNTKTLLEAVIESEVPVEKFVVSGSQTAAGPSPDGVPITEERETKPITTYGRSKLEQENLVLSYKDKLPVTVLRCPAIYGERDTEVGIFFQTYAKRLFTKVGFDKKTLSLLHVHDVVNGLYLAALSPKSSGEVYFLSSEKVYTWNEVGEVTKKIFGRGAVKLVFPHFMVYTVAAIAQFFSVFSSKPATLNLEKARDLVQKHWVSSPAKAMRDFGFRQEVSLEEGVRRTIEWYKKEGWI
ncbi:MAG: NAD-dependent epimerase/dehydratase family protein [Ignavibacteriaceae bacterium]|nr:MAG: NAD-dependent epimerase/dehydratase family protein [Ignavibacteriaceae bacterium]MBZ0197587.1 NAD-dependent epimerase/dehydratase family protein [Ignavibacteriaceae bacterium]